VRGFIVVGIVVLVAVAVLTVLITPDQTDDVKALLHKCSLQVYLLAGVYLKTPVSRRSIAEACGFGLFDTPRPLIDLTCVRLC
jgi:hypothetical protein